MKKVKGRKEMKVKKSQGKFGMSTVVDTVLITVSDRVSPRSRFPGQIILAVYNPRSLVFLRADVNWRETEHVFSVIACAPALRAPIRSLETFNS